MKQGLGIQVVRKIEDYNTLDPTTKAFLNSCMHPVFGFPTFIRFSWSTIPKLISEKKGVEIVWYE